MQRLAAWTPDQSFQLISVIDAHTEGEPLRVITRGFPELAGRTILEKRRDCQQRFDAYRRTLMAEPRGHSDMYGVIVTPPATADSHFGVVFLHNEGYSTMCGHGIIGVVTVLVETGALDAAEGANWYGIDTPAGPVCAQATVRDNRVTRVSFRNVPSFADTEVRTVEIPGIGRVPYQIAFGGAYYAFVEAADVGLRCEPAYTARLIEMGRLISATIPKQHQVVHPFEPDLSFLYGVIFTGPGAAPDAHSRHVCVFADGQVDRSPTGTGVSARIALLHAKGEVALQQALKIESIIGSSFQVAAVEQVTFGPHQSVVPEVSGTAFLTARCDFLIDPRDPLREGFLLK